MLASRWDENNRQKNPEPHQNVFLLGGWGKRSSHFLYEGTRPVPWRICGAAYLAGVVTALKSLNPNFLLT